MRSFPVCLWVWQECWMSETHAQSVRVDVSDTPVEQLLAFLYACWFVQLLNWSGWYLLVRESGLCTEVVTDGHLKNSDQVKLVPLVKGNVSRPQVKVNIFDQNKMKRQYMWCTYSSLGRGSSHNILPADQYLLLVGCFCYWEELPVPHHWWDLLSFGSWSVLSCWYSMPLLGMTDIVACMDLVQYPLTLLHHQQQSHHHYHWAQGCWSVIYLQFSLCSLVIHVHGGWRRRLVVKVSPEFTLLKFGMVVCSSN